MTDLPPDQQPQAPYAAPQPASLFSNPYVLGGVALAVVLVLGLGGYFLFFHKSVPAKYANDPVKAKLAMRTVCEATVDRVLDYGVIPYTGKIESKDSEKTDNEKRVICRAGDGATKFTILVDVECDDMADDKCLTLFNVKNNAGETLYQKS